MDFLDNLILGRNTPSYADGSSFPSKTFKKNNCRRKHCDKKCLKEPGGNWEFWALVLSCKPLNRFELANKIENLAGCLRFSVWNRICSTKLPFEENKQFPSEEFEKRDQLLLDAILKKIKGVDIDEEKLFNIIISSLDQDIPDIDLFVELIHLILKMPFADLIYLENILKFFNRKLKIQEIFTAEPKDPQEDYPSEGIEQDLASEEAKPFYILAEYLIRKDFMYFCKILDLLLCFRNCTLKEALIFLANKSDQQNFESLTSICNLNSLKEYLSNKQGTLGKSDNVKELEVTYYDFIVVQNETIKAQEHIKKEFVDRITELETKNKDLELSLEHFKEVSSSLEQELSNYQEGYVKDLTKFLDETKKQNDDLQKEVLKLKEENLKLKKNFR